jgi:glycosyltransferase involved in cell wall biosynthesis
MHALSPRVGRTLTSAGDLPAKGMAYAAVPPQGRIPILQVIPKLGPGGTERFVVELSQSLAQGAFAPHICVLGSACAFPDRLAGLENVVFLHSRLRWSDPLDTIRTIGALRRLIGEVKPALVHSHLWTATRNTAMALLGTSIPHVVHVHNCWSIAPVNLRRRLERDVIDLLLARTPTRFVAVSRHTRDLVGQYLRSARQRTEVVHNGANTAEFLPAHGRETRALRSGHLVIASVGSLEERKGQDLIIDAVAALAARGVDAEVLLAGEGPWRSRYEQLAHDRGIGSRVKFLGLVEDIPSLLAQADVFVLASRDEEMPLVVLEAMAMGLPVLATSVGGVPEMIRDNVDGLLLHERDADALASRLFRLASDNSERIRLGRAAAMTVARRFSAARTAAEIERCYRDLI